MTERSPKVLWQPTAETVERAAITRYMGWLREDRGLQFSDYQALWAWSVEHLDEFWASIWDFFDVQARTPYDRVLVNAEMPGARWFPGARLNWAEHALRMGGDDQPAILYASETHLDVQTLTWRELRDLVARVASGLRRLGVGPGDRVAAYLPNCPEAVASLLACAALGAVWSSCSPDFGTRTVVDRFGQIEPKVLLAGDGYCYGGRAFDRTAVVAELVAALPSLEHVVLLPCLDPAATVAGSVGWNKLTSAHEPLTCQPVAFEHPLWVLYSSGTTGLPKAIVHGHGGVLLEQLKHNHLHLDVQADDRVFWFTTTGWMMWNLLAGCLLTGATVVLFEGNPGYPSLDVLWDLAERARLTHFGASASYIASCMKSDIKPAGGRDLSSLRAVGSTGSPLAPNGFRWIYEEVGRDTWLVSMSGGSDLCTAFVTGNPTLLVCAGELQCRALGADVQSWDENGQPLIGRVGELVLCQPMPSMPLHLWNDPSGERYREAYFYTYPGIWRHGDWIEITDRGTAIIYGRSDSTINRGGIRMGTAEIYSALLGLPEIVDALVVDVHEPGTEGWMPLFIVLAQDAQLDDKLRRRVATRIREGCSPRHVPNDVFVVPAIPRTLTGKALEVPVKRLLSGSPPDQVASRDALANPDALDWFAEFAATRNLAKAT